MSLNLSGKNYSNKIHWAGQSITGLPLCAQAKDKHRHLRYSTSFGWNLRMTLLPLMWFRPLEGQDPKSARKFLKGQAFLKKAARRNVGGRSLGAKGQRIRKGNLCVNLSYPNLSFLRLYRRYPDLPYLTLCLLYLKNLWKSFKGRLIRNLSDLRRNLKMLKTPLVPMGKNLNFRAQFHSKLHNKNWQDIQIILAQKFKIARLSRKVFPSLFSHENSKLQKYLPIAFWRENSNFYFDWFQVFLAKLGQYGRRRQYFPWFWWRFGPQWYNWRIWCRCTQMKIAVKI